MKKLKYLILAIVLFLTLQNVSAFDKELKVYDYAQVLTPEEEEKLKEKSIEFTEKYNMDIIMVTVKYHEKSTTKAYAQDFYDYNGFGVGNTHDGLIFVIDFNFNEKSDFYISTTGEAIRMYDDYRINSILDSIDDEYYKNSEDYFNMFLAFINASDKYASLGVPSSNSNTRIDSNGDLVYKTGIPWFKITLISLIISSAIVIFFIMKNKMVRKSVNANEYLKKDSVVINNRSDKFITTHTTSVRINDSSSGGRVGGSSTSRGSSGVSHGGGGRSH